MARAIEGLNQLTESEIRRLLAGYDERLALARTVVATNATLRIRPDFLVDSAVIRRMSACCLHALEECLDSIPQLISEAVDCYMTLFRLRDLREEADRRASGKPVDISFFSAERMSAVVIDSLILGRLDVLETVATMDHALYSNFHPPSIGVHHASIGALTAYAAGDIPTAKRRLAPLLQHPDWQANPTPVVERLRPFMEGVMALCDAQPDGVSAALDKLLAINRTHSQQDFGARHPATLFCAEATALAAMARRAGHPVAADSPYIPAGLIG